MHTKPISTEVIVSHEATLTSGFAKLIIKDGKLGFSNTLKCDPTVQQFYEDMINALTVNDDKPCPRCHWRLILKKLKAFPFGVTGGDEQWPLVFEATVVYPYILENFGLTKGMREILQRLIHQRFTSAPKNSDSESEEETRTRIWAELKAYFAYVDEHFPKQEGQEDFGLDYNEVDMMGYEAAFGALKDGSFRAKVEKIPDFPLGLLPWSSTSSSNEANVFQTAWKRINDVKPEYLCANDYAKMQRDLLPVLYIIANMKGQDEEGKPMEEGVKENLFRDLSAAKCFYSKLRQMEVTTKFKTRSEILEKDIEAILQTLQRPAVTENQKLEERSIFKFLCHCHHIARRFKALAAYGRLKKLNNERTHRTLSAQCIALAKFCDQFQIQLREDVVYQDMIKIREQTND